MLRIGKILNNSVNVTYFRTDRFGSKCQTHLLKLIAIQFDELQNRFGASQVLMVGKKLYSFSRSSQSHWNSINLCLSITRREINMNKHPPELFLQRWRISYKLDTMRTTPSENRYYLLSACALCDFRIPTKCHLKQQSERMMHRK